MGLQSPQLSHPPTSLPVIGAGDLEFVDLTNYRFIGHMLKVFLSAVRARLLLLLCAKPVGEAGGTEVLATADSKMSIAKDFGTDGAVVLAGNGVFKLIVIATIHWLVTGRRKRYTIRLSSLFIHCGEFEPSVYTSSFPSSPFSYPICHLHLIFMLHYQL